MESQLKPPTEVQLKRRTKELALLSKLPPTIKYQVTEAPIGCTVYVEIEKDHFKSKITKSVAIDVLMNYKYPFQPPKVHLKTDFTEMTMCDGRDLMPSIMPREWLPSTTIYDIILSIPALIDEMFENKDNPQYLKDLGTFHLGELYDLNWFTNCIKIQCSEESGKPPIIEPRIMIISDFCLLLFEEEEEEKKEGGTNQYAKLVFWSGLEFLEKLRRNLKSPQKLHSYWTQKEAAALEVILLVEEPDVTIDTILRKMRNLGAEINCNKKNLKTVVNTMVPTEREILELVESINKLEEDPGSHHIELMKAYQKAVEYYSAVGSSEYIVYLNKIRELVKVKGEQNDKFMT